MNLTPEQEKENRSARAWFVFEDLLFSAVSASIITVIGVALYHMFVTGCTC